MSEYVYFEPRTVCVECKHMERPGKFNCTAQPRTQRWSTVTGEKEQNPNPPCHIVNDGNCSYYEKA